MVERFHVDTEHYRNFNHKFPLKKTQNLVGVEPLFFGDRESQKETGSVFTR